MSTTLDVVNECLGTMGEVPLNSLATPHEFKGAALRALSRADKRWQTRGWWYNTEELTLAPSPDNGHITLPGDILRVDNGFVSQSGQPQPHQDRYVQRGRRLYDTVNGTFVIEATLRVRIVRQVPYEDLPVPINELIACEAIFKFQSNYDSDTNKRQELQQDLTRAITSAVQEDTRQRRVNLLESNPRLSRIKSRIRGARY